MLPASEEHRNKALDRSRVGYRFSNGSINRRGDGQRKRSAIKMKTYDVDSTYSQVYVADERLEPSAPEDWTEEHLEQRHYTLDHIVALCPVSDIVARITSYGLTRPQWNRRIDQTLKS